jgi:hypothetical protein
MRASGPNTRATARHPADSTPAGLGSEANPRCDRHKRQHHPDRGMSPHRPDLFPHVLQTMGVDGDRHAALAILVPIHESGREEFIYGLLVLLG